MQKGIPSLLSRSSQWDQTEGGSLYPCIRITGSTLGCVNYGDGIYFSEHIARAFAEGIIGLQSISVINNIAIDAIDNIIIRNFFLIFRS